MQSGAPAPDAADVWRWEPSVAHFELLARDLPTLAAEKTPHEYVITASGESSRGPSLVRLILTRPGLRPVEQRIVFKRGEAADDLVEYRLIEADARTVPLASMAAGVFEPNPELLPEVAAPSERPRRATVTPLVEPALADADADALELEVTYRLHRLENCVQGDPSIDRGARRVRVSVAIETDACRLETRRPFESLEVPRSGRSDAGSAAAPTRGCCYGADRTAADGGRDGRSHRIVLPFSRRGGTGQAGCRERGGGDRPVAVDRRPLPPRPRGSSCDRVARHHLGRAPFRSASRRRLAGQMTGSCRDHARSLGSDAESLRVQWNGAPATGFRALRRPHLGLADVPRAAVELTRSPKRSTESSRSCWRQWTPFRTAELMRELVTALATLTRSGSVSRTVVADGPLTAG